MKIESTRRGLALHLANPLHRHAQRQQNAASSYRQGFHHATNALSAALSKFTTLLMDLRTFVHSLTAIRRGPDLPYAYTGLAEFDHDEMR